MRRNSAFSFLITHTPIYRPVHSDDYLIGREGSPRLGRASQLSIDNIADAFEDAAHQTLRQDRLSFGGLVLFVSHESGYELRVKRVHATSSSKIVHAIFAAILAETASLS